MQLGHNLGVITITMRMLLKKSELNGGQSLRLIYKYFIMNCDANIFYYAQIVTVLLWYYRLLLLGHLMMNGKFIRCMRQKLENDFMISLQEKSYLETNI